MTIFSWYTDVALPALFCEGLVESFIATMLCKGHSFVWFSHLVFEGKPVSKQTTTSFRDTYIEREAGESANDRNDRAIRTAALWYQKHLQLTTDSNMTVLLLTDDADNRKKAVDMGIVAFTGELIKMIMHV